MARKILAVIPARLGSTRFSNKVIYPLNGKPLLFYVHKDVSKSKMIDRVVIATDSDEIQEIAEGFGAEVVRTSRKHQTGSDRVAEVAQEVGGDIVLNIQADVFGLKPSVMDKTISRMLDDRSIEFATLARRIESDDDLFDPNLVKVIIDNNSDALWFSRFPLPYLQRCESDNRFSQHPFLGHIGVYFFRRAALARFKSWRRSPLEKAESLEQLRIIENGGHIRVFKTRARTLSVDCPEDVKKISHLYIGKR